VLPELKIRGAGTRNISVTEDQNQPVSGRKKPGASRTSSPRNPTVVALLIGIDRAPVGTGLADLEGAVADMELLRCALVEGLGVPVGNIELLTEENANRTAIWRTLDVLTRTTRVQDMVVIAYAGHGGSRKEDGVRTSFLMTADQKTFVGDLLERLAELPARNRLLLVDACRSGQPPFGQAFRLTSADLRRASSLAWMASCTESQQSYEIDGQGFFSSAVAEALHNSSRIDTDRDGFLDFSELGEHVHRTVEARAKAVGQEQTPIYSVLNWPGDQRLFRVRRPWTIRLAGAPVMRTMVEGHYAPDRLRPDEQLWVVVAPRQSGGRWWPMASAVTRRKHNLWEARVHLGNRYSPAGEMFRILLVKADAALAERFREYIRGPANGANQGMYVPQLRNLPTVAELSIRRAH
jgi:hypothetical protein